MGKVGIADNTTNEIFSRNINGYELIMDGLIMDELIMNELTRNEFISDPSDD